MSKKRGQYQFPELFRNIREQVRNPINLIDNPYNKTKIKKTYLYWYHHLTLEPFNSQSFSRYCLWKTCCEFQPELYEEYEILGFEYFKKSKACPHKTSLLRKMASLRNVMKERKQVIYHLNYIRDKPKTRRIRQKTNQEKKIN